MNKGQRKRTLIIVGENEQRTKKKTPTTIGENEQMTKKKSTNNCW
jgi:hypothetical protein